MTHKVFENRFESTSATAILRDCFHPQYFVLINELMEDFLEDVAGVGLLKSAATVWVSQW